MKALTAIVLTVVAAGCSGSNISLSVRAGAPTASAVSRSALTFSNGIVLNRVRIVVKEINLELAKSPDAGVADLEEHEMALGPYLVDLSGASLDSGAPDHRLTAGRHLRGDQVQDPEAAEQRPGRLHRCRPPGHGGGGRVDHRGRHHRRRRLQLLDADGRRAGA